MEITVTIGAKRGTGLIAMLALGTVLAGGLSACGSQGYAQPLGKPATAALSGSTGAGASTYTARITPISAVRIVVTYRGKTVPLSGAQTPAQLRRGSCFGAYVAPLTDGNPAQPAEAPGVHDATVASAPDPTGGMDVEVAPDASLFVDVMARPNDPTAPVVACGQPLSGRRQYFDLYPPTNNSVATGNALLDPITAAQVAISPASGTAAAPAPVAWTIHTGGCDGVPAGGATIAAAAKAPYGGLVYVALTPGQWWVTLALSDGTTLCGQTKTT